ncbi:MAG: ABC transporter ATP-binding protein [Candidatus Methylomirabilia bacterium]
MTPILEVQDLHVRYGSIRALQGVSVAVGAGEIVSLIGPNGAGKSTLINTVSGLHRPAGGSIRFRGEEITRASVHRIVARGVVQVPEGRAILKNLSVGENLELGGASLEARGAIQRNMRRVLDYFPALHERVEQLGGTLSGGEQQMLAIGRALMAEPRILLMDEPSLGLAPRLVNQIFQIVADLKAMGIPILLVEQNARKALACADRGYVLENGRIITTGSAQELAANELVRRAYLGAAVS